MPGILAGDEGIGKTTIALQISKEIIEENPHNSVLWFATEGTIADTFQKAMEMGLPQDGRFRFAEKPSGDFVFNFKYESERRLLDTLLETTEPKPLAVFIDSIRGMTEQSVNEEEVGNTMRKLNAIVCDKHKCTPIYLHHNNKKTEGSWRNRITGTGAILAAVRVALMILPQGKYIRRLVVAKSNLFAEMPELNVVKQGGALQIYDDGEPFDTETDKAEKFILELFKDRAEMAAKDIYQLGKIENITVKSLKEARYKIPGLVSIKKGNFWVWVLRGVK
jgi:predicted ATP-dependent serine protease